MSEQTKIIIGWCFFAIVASTITAILGAGLIGFLTLLAELFS